MCELLYLRGVGRYKFCRHSFKIAFQASSECFCVKTGALVRFLGPLGGLVWFSGTSAVLRIKIGKIAFIERFNVQ